MSSEATAWAWQRRGLTSSTKFVLLALAEFADDQHCSATPRERLMGMTGLSESAVRRAIGDMVKAGLISAVEDVIRRDPCGARRLVPLYRLAVVSRSRQP